MELAKLTVEFPKNLKLGLHFTTQLCFSPSQFRDASNFKVGIVNVNDVFGIGQT